ncbi:MAG: Uma2 family endonuclease [Planctomycetaceae bacterium]|nr:Uma2 family endonuclease [Planctomycetaceae bacterium]
MSAVPVPHYTLEEYFERERTSSIKHEYYCGQIFAMAGGSETHALVSGNCIRELGNSLKGRSCRVYTSDMRIKCATGLYTYPDVSAVCGPPEMEPRRNDVLCNASVVFEIVSPSSEAYDRGDKFEHYRALPSLRDYVVVSLRRPTIQRFSRSSSEAQWTLTFISGLDASLEIPSLGVKIPLAEIFANVEFPPEDLSGEPPPGTEKVEGRHPPPPRVM